MEERSLTGTLHDDGFILFPNGDRAPVWQGMPPNRVRVPAVRPDMLDEYEALPLVDWPPTVYYRYVGQVPLKD